MGALLRGIHSKSSAQCKDSPIGVVTRSQQMVLKIANFFVCLRGSDTMEQFLHKPLRSFPKAPNVTTHYDQYHLGLLNVSFCVSFVPLPPPPFIQLGMVRTASLSFIAWAAKAFSLLRRQAPLVKPPANVSEPPIWHNVFFGNEHRRTYYCPPRHKSTCSAARQYNELRMRAMTICLCHRGVSRALYPLLMALISQGVRTWGAFYGEHHPRNHRTLPRTWKPVYSAAHRILNTAKLQEIFDLPDTWALCWGKGFFLRFASPDPDTPEQQPNWVWEEWVRAKFHPTTKEFVQRALWHKLMVHDRIFTLTGTNCPPLWKKRKYKACSLGMQILPCDFWLVK